MRPKNKRNNKITYDYSKIYKLNFNLKNTIFSFLPLNQVVENIIRVEKKFVEAIRRKKDFKILYNKLDYYTSTINFQKKEIRNITNDFVDLDLSEEQMKEILFYLLNRKFRLLITTTEVYIYFLHCDFDFVCEFLKKNNSLKNIAFEFGKNLLNENRVKILYNILRKSKIITKLNLSNNAIGEKEYDMMYLGKMIEKSQSIRDLNLSNNLIGQNLRDFEYLSNALLNNRVLRCLNLNHNLIGLSDYNVFNICKIIKQNSTLHTLNIFDNLIFDNVHLADIHNVLGMNNTLRFFSMHFRDIGNYELKFFRDMKYMDSFILFMLWGTFIIFSIVVFFGKTQIGGHIKN